MTGNVLDLFQPEVIINTIKYQATSAESDWEQRHIDAMNTACEYMRNVYPVRYQEVVRIHTHFLNKQPNI